MRRLHSLIQLFAARIKPHRSPCCGIHRSKRISTGERPHKVGPFVASYCFALRYGSTHRVVTLQSNAETPTPESFEPALFPGESMEGLRGRNGGDSNSFQVDLKAVEARLEAEREKDQDAEELAEQAQQAEQELQATGVVPTPPAEPDWTEPTLPAFEPEPAPVVPQDPPAPPVQPAVVTEPAGTSDRGASASGTATASAGCSG